MIFNKDFKNRRLRTVNDISMIFLPSNGAANGGGRGIISGAMRVAMAI